MCDAEWKNRGEEDGKVIKEEERNEMFFVRRNCGVGSMAWDGEYGSLKGRGISVPK
jgi:hypothetical protein